jgi:hypothetical protein
MSLKVKIKGLQKEKLTPNAKEQGKKHEKEEKDICDIFSQFFIFKTPFFVVVLVHFK